MLVKVALVYLVIACASFVWSARLFQNVDDEQPTIAHARKIAPKSTALLIATVVLVMATFWPATLAMHFAFCLVAKRFKKEMNRDDDDDDDGMPQEA